MHHLTGFNLIGNRHIQLYYLDADGDRSTCTVLLENIILMQYTGLKDKNGMEIYEGDIVRCIELRNDKINEWISEVYWEQAGIWVHESENCDTPLDLFFPGIDKYPLTEIEIRGNIFENPELITQLSTDNL